MNTPFSHVPKNRLFYQPIGTCAICKKDIAFGEPLLRSKGVPVVHLRCLPDDFEPQDGQLMDEIGGQLP